MFQEENIKLIVNSETTLDFSSVFNVRPRAPSVITELLGEGGVTDIWVANSQLMSQDICLCQMILEVSEKGLYVWARIDWIHYSSVQ